MTLALLSPINAFGFFMYDFIANIQNTSCALDFINFNFLKYISLYIHHFFFSLCVGCYTVSVLGSD